MYQQFHRVARRIGVVVGRSLTYVLIWAGLTLGIAAAGIHFYWGTISVDQMLLNLVSVEAEGGGGALVWAGILAVGVLPLLITAGIALWLYYRRHRRRQSGDGGGDRSPWLMRFVSTVVVAALVIGGSTAFSSAVGIVDYIQAQNSDYDVRDYYVQPTVTSDLDKRNLVLIYLESGEATFEDDQLFEKDAFAPLKEVTKASQGWQSIDPLYNYRGGGWTMAGLVGTQCGIPLKGGGPAPKSGSLNGLNSTIGAYLEGSTCAGDILDAHGFTSVFLGGANADFAAKGTFLETHGYSEVKDLADWRAAGEPEENFSADWGLSDGRLMAYAEDEIDELHAEAERTGQPFNLSMLTLDSHEPAHVFDYCSVDTQITMTSVFSCSMAQVAGFVDHMRTKGYLDDTAVIIMGDHLKLLSAGDPFHEQLDDNPHRTIFNRVWVPGRDSSSTLRPDVDQLNMFATILEASGLTLKDSEAGLGVSAFTATIPDDSAQAMQPDSYIQLIESQSREFYDQAWADEGLVE